MCRFVVLRLSVHSSGRYAILSYTHAGEVRCNNCCGCRLRCNVPAIVGCDRASYGNHSVAASLFHAIGSLLSAVGEILLSNNKGKTRCGCTRRAAQSGLQDERRLALLRLGTLRLSHTLVYGFPESVGSIGLEVAEAVVYVFFPISLHSRKELLVLYCFIFLASIAFALCSCDADVLSFMPSSEAISLWLLSSTT